MNYERRNAVIRVRQYLYDALAKTNVDSDEFYNLRALLKHYPSDYDMERAAEQAPEVFGDFSYYKEQK
jgi:hypothetical protein